jgi:hypothetical protein
VETRVVSHCGCDDCRALAARVPLLEAVVKAARGLRWVHPLDRGRYEAKFDEAVAALDEKSTP